MKGSFLKMLNKNLTFVILAASLLAVFSARAYSLPIIQNEEITTGTDTSVIITWTTTNENSDTKVYYGTGTPSNVYSSLESTKYHYAIIDSLSPGTTYYYYVKSGSTEGSQKIFTTLTPPSGSYLFSFATVSDPQYGMGKSDTYGARGRPYSKSKQMLEALVSSLNRLNPSFTILKGDLIESLGGTYGEYVDNQNIPGDTETIKDKLDNLTGAYYPIPGNHDKEITAYSGGNTSSWYNSNLSPLNPSLVIPDPTKNSCYNYSFDTNGYRFIMLDSIRSNLTASIDATYLSTQLLSAESLGLKSFIFVHHPVTDLRSEGIPAEVLKEVAGGTEDYSKIQIMNTAEVWSILNSHKDSIAGVFSGHIHDNHYSELYGIPCVRTASALQFPSGFNIYKVYSNGFIQSFYKIPVWTEIAREVVTPEAGYSDIYWEQFGLGSLSSRNFSHTMENVPPSVSFTTPTNNLSSVPINDKITIKFTKPMSKTETQNAITFSPSIASKSFEWTEDDMLVINHSNLSASTTYEITVGTGARDLNGEYFVSAQTFRFTTSSSSDTVPPNASIEAFPLNITNNNQPTFTGIATDELSPITSIECRIDAGEWTGASPLDGNFNSKTEGFTFKSPIDLTRSFSPHLIEVRAKDAAGNIKTENFDNYSFYVIGDRPEIGIRISSLEITSGDPVQKNPSFEVVVISNRGLDLYPLYAKLDKNAPVTLTKHFDPAEPAVVTASYNPSLSDGVHSLIIQISDDLGNITTREVVGLVVDNGSSPSLQGPPLNYPNPYNGTGSVRIGYTLSKNSSTSISIHDLTGNQLKKMSFSSGINGGKAGYNDITWDGKTDSGQDLGNGIYIYLIAADGALVGKGKLAVVK